MDGSLENVILVTVLCIHSFGRHFDMILVGFFGVLPHFGHVEVRPAPRELL